MISSIGSAFCLKFRPNSSSIFQNAFDGVENHVEVDGSMVISHSVSDSGSSSPRVLNCVDAGEVYCEEHLFHDVVYISWFEIWFSDNFSESFKNGNVTLVNDVLE